jgi:putative transposase
VPYWRCYYPIIWTTKHRTPTILVEYEPILFATIEQKVTALKCGLLAVNSAFDHIHLALTIPPSLAVAHVIGQIKGTTSHSLNNDFEPPERFEWQDGYGVLTFSEHAKSRICEYIARQKEHHAQGSINPLLEAVE